MNSQLIILDGIVTSHGAWQVVSLSTVTKSQLHVNDATAKYKTTADVKEQGSHQRVIHHHPSTTS